MTFDKRHIAATTQTISASTSTTRKTLSGAGDFLRISNAGSVPVFFEIGGSSVTVNGFARFAASTDSISLGSSIAPFATPAAFTVASKLRYQYDLSAAGSILALLHAYDGAGDGLRFRILQDGTIQTNLYNATTLSFTQTDPGAYPNDTDEHIVGISHNGTTMVISVDGVEKKSAAVTQHGAIGSTVTIGYGASIGNLLYVQMDYLYIHDAVKAPAEIAASNTDDLVASYDFIEGFTDGTGSNNGTASGTVLGKTGGVVLAGQYRDVKVDDFRSSTTDTHISVVTGSSTATVYVEELARVGK